MLLGDHVLASSAVYGVYISIRSEDWALENEPELCGLGHFCVYGMRRHQR